MLRSRVQSRVTLCRWKLCEAVESRSHYRCWTYTGHLASSSNPSWRRYVHLQIRLLLQGMILFGPQTSSYCTNDDEVVMNTKW